MKLMDWGFANYAAIPIVDKGAAVERLRVTKGTAREVTLVAGADLIITMPRASRKTSEKSPHRRLFSKPPWRQARSAANSLSSKTARK
jgi:D-alanyl-D-alanine carboxypeptidase